MTESLAAALQHLRYPDRARTIWVDAICINQGINSEKNHQIALMGSIYSQAQRTLAWLGAADDDVAGRAFDYVSRLDAYLRSHLEDYETKKLGLEPINVPNRILTELSVSWLPGLYEALGPLFASPWFHRLWVVQEIVLAKYVELIFGTRTIFLDRLLSPVFIMGGFVVFVHCPALFDVDAFHNLFYMGVIKMRFDLVQPHPNPSYNILHVFRQVQNLVAADPRDMIYGLLGLGYASGFKADYTLSPEEVFRDFATWCLRSSPNNLLVLSYAGLSRSASDWVSWVPQPYLCKIITPFSEISHFRASGDIIERRNESTENSWYLSGRNVLQLRGRFIDDVVKIANV